VDTQQDFTRGGLRDRRVDDLQDIGIAVRGKTNSAQRQAPWALPILSHLYAMLSNNLV
jgi:hypothetical protein